MIRTRERSACAFRAAKTWPGRAASDALSHAQMAEVGMQFWGLALDVEGAGASTLLIPIPAKDLSKCLRGRCLSDRLDDGRHRKTHWGALSRSDQRGPYQKRVTA